MQHLDLAFLSSPFPIAVPSFHFTSLVSSIHLQLPNCCRLWFGTIRTFVAVQTQAQPFTESSMRCKHNPQQRRLLASSIADAKQTGPTPRKSSLLSSLSSLPDLLPYRLVTSPTAHFQLGHTSPYLFLTSFLDSASRQRGIPFHLASASTYLVSSQSLPQTQSTHRPLLARH